VLLPFLIHFLRDEAVKSSGKYSAKVCAFFMLLLAQVPCDVLSGGDFLTFSFSWSPSVGNNQWILLV
jgi:hypothetical protein